MLEYALQAIKSVEESEVSYCKFITANDVGTTGGHQYGFYIHKDAYSIAFEVPQKRGTNNENIVTIKWHDDVETESRFIYYGQKTRNEYRLTRIRQEILQDENIGSLLVLVKLSSQYYKGYVLDNDEEIDYFLDYFGISPQQANGIVSKAAAVPTDLTELYKACVAGFHEEFPSTATLADAARQLYATITGRPNSEWVSNPDATIAGWVNVEYELFKTLEVDRYADIISKPFSGVEELVNTSNTILNRRKSRAGKSLEHHLAKIFDANSLPYSAQGITENNNKPDFIMPGIESYHDIRFETEKLVFLGAKTTCKDRWRQVLDEASRIDHKHLFTLQPGISSAQLDQMEERNLTLVVPEQNISLFPVSHQSKLMGLKEFISYAKNTVS